jgi:hypothetical protein
MAESKKQPAEQVPIEVVLRLQPELAGQMTLAAQGLGLAVPDLIHMVLLEHLAAYIERGNRAAIERTKAQNCEFNQR